MSFRNAASVPFAPFSRRRFLPSSLGVAVAFAIACLAITGSLALAGPDLINYQGYLRDNDGNPVEGSVTLNFRLFDAEVAGSAFWSEQHTDVDVDAGIFHVILGSVVPIPASALDGAERWLQTIVDGELMVPRRQFVSVPYALHAQVAEVALSTADVDDDWVIVGDHVYHAEGSVVVGSSNSSPIQPLEVAGDVSVGGGTEGLIDGNSEFVSIRATSDTWYIGTQNEGTVADSDFFIGTSSVENGTFHIENGGDVGIGTSNPLAKLHVLGKSEADYFEADTDLGDFARPRPGGLYQDNVIYAWANVGAAGQINSSFGVSAVNWSGAGTGFYEVVLERTLGSGLSVIVTPYSTNDPYLAGAVAHPAGDRVDVRMRLELGGSFVFYDAGFYIQVVGRP